MIGRFRHIFERETQPTGVDGAVVRLLEACDKKIAQCKADMQVARDGLAKAQRERRRLERRMKVVP